MLKGYSSMASSDKERTPLQDLERKALKRNFASVVKVVKALRKYREAANTLLSSDFVAVEDVEDAIKAFNDAVDEIENNAEDYT